MKSIFIGIIIIFAITIDQTFAGNFEHIKTFGFDYGYPQEVDDLNWLATHHDALIGIGHWQTKKVDEFQYNTLKAANPDVLIIPYVVTTAFTFDEMEALMREHAINNGQDPEELYLHFYYDNVVKTQSPCVATGEGLGKCCQEDGTLLKEGESSRYYLSKGFGGGTAKSLKEARTYQYWNAGFKPKMNHLSNVWVEAYRAYLLEVITVNSSQGKFCDGVFGDSYALTLTKTGYAPNTHQLIEVRNAGYGDDDTVARNFYATEMAKAYGGFSDWLEAQTGKEKIYIVPNFSEHSYIYQIMPFAMADQFDTPGFNVGSIEYLSRPSATGYWQVQNHFRDFYDDIANGMTWFSLNDTIVPYETGRPYGVISALIAGFYLFNAESTYWGFHYGSPSYYDKNPTWETSHWHELMEYDIGFPIIRQEFDFWGESNTNRMFVIEESKGELRMVMGREYSKGMVIVRYDSYTSWDDAGSDPRTYELPGTFQQVLEGNILGPPISTLTLGKAEGAILAKIPSNDPIPLIRHMSLKQK